MRPGEHYDFRERFTAGERAARTLEFHILSQFPGTLVRRASMADERRGIDLWLKRPDDQAVISIQVKSDEKMSRTGNFFIETVSVYPHKRGWVWTTEAHTLCYIDEGNWVVYWLQMEQLRQAFNAHWGHVPEKSVPNNGYITKGVPVPKFDVISKLHPLTTSLRDEENYDPFTEDEPDDY